MQTVAESQGGLSVSPVVPELCKLVVVYEDLETARDAQDQYENILTHLKQPGEPAYSLWKAGLLEHPKLRQMAATEASRADVVILSIHADRELPQAIRDWIELWMEQPQPGAAILVALFDQVYGPSFGRPATCRYLEESAQRSGLSLMVLDSGAYFQR